MRHAGRGRRRVLAVDADPQFALTRQLGVGVSELPLTLVDVLSGRVEAAERCSPKCTESTYCQRIASSGFRPQVCEKQR